MSAQFEISFDGNERRVQLVDGDGAVLMSSEPIDLAEANDVMAKVGQAVGRVMEPKKPGAR